MYWIVDAARPIVQFDDWSWYHEAEMDDLCLKKKPYSPQEVYSLFWERNKKLPLLSKAMQGNGKSCPCFLSVEAWLAHDGESYYALVFSDTAVLCLDYYRKDGNHLYVEFCCVDISKSTTFERYLDSPSLDTTSDFSIYFFRAYYLLSRLANDRDLAVTVALSHPYCASNKIVLCENATNARLSYFPTWYKRQAQALIRQIPEVLFKKRPVMQHLQRLTRSGKKYFETGPTTSESLRFPNMKFSPYGDFEVESTGILEKRQARAECNGEISLLPYCTTRVRRKFHSKKIQSFYDPDFMSHLSLFVTNSYHRWVMDSIVRWNLSEENQVGAVYLPKGPLPELNTGTYFMVDFETLLDPYWVYLIGVKEAVLDENKQWSLRSYRAFWMETLDVHEQYRVMKEMMDWIGETHRIIYYFAEPMFWSRICTLLSIRNVALSDSIINFFKRKDYTIDLCRVVMYAPVIIKGVFNFKLKSFEKVTEYMSDHRGNGECTTGMTSVKMAKKYYYEQEGCPTIKNTLERYNEKDCDLLFFLLKKIMN